MIWVNFKTYKQGTGRNAIKLAEICQKVEKESSIKVFPLVQAVDIFRLASCGFEVWSQHVDNINFGPNTGRILPWAVKEAGAVGTLVNHSENKLLPEAITGILEICRTLGLKTLVCCESLEEAKRILEVKPDLIAYEPPELIGSQTDSVSSAKPEVIKNFVNIVKRIPVLVGAGIHCREDVKMALELGARGVLVASDVVLAKDPEKELRELAGGFK